MRGSYVAEMLLLFYAISFKTPRNSTMHNIHSKLFIFVYAYILYIYIIQFVSLYLYIPDEGSLLLKYRDCTTSNDFELYLMCCGVMLLLLIIIYI